MKLFTNIKNWFREQGEHAGETVLADSVRDGKFAVADSQKLIGQFRADTAGFVSENKRIGRELGDTQNDVKKWTQVKAAATAAGNAEDAAKADGMLIAAQRQAITLKQEYDANDKAIAKLRSQISAADAKVAGAKGQIIQLAARERGAQVRTALAKASAQFGASNSPLAALDDLQSQVEAHEDMADALEEEASTSTGDDLATKYSAPDDSVGSDYDKMFGTKTTTTEKMATAAV